MGFFLILMPILFVQVNCKSPAEPSNHVVFAYRYNVKVIYERNPNDITNPECKNDIEIRYYLYDPSGAGDTGGTINPERARMHLLAISNVCLFSQEITKEDIMFGFKTLSFMMAKIGFLQKHRMVYP